ncbi:hypothetical protein NL108_017300 [Boleophthalmus pectinirostris]|uniref:cystatin-A1-like n=1 Tax=Boleophthalmus pectinirostris TaxID=150288 RepID=UPI00242DDC6C|nr:cystatin-A1-like [Boleophthalmus pectinirostris]KAJ0061366.1 hypothetical protein NL108_017300 [Boleophthalmus pectinirostris]
MESDKKCGGIEDPQPADAKVQTICDSVKSEVEKLTGENYKIFRALSYKKQLVAGMNYFIEVFIGGDKYLEVDVFWGLIDTNREPVVLRVLEISKTIVPLNPK